jgi:hypothetical protein
MTALAEPIRWELQLFGGGSILRGQRIYTGVEYSGETILNLSQARREAEWAKVR